MTFVTVPDEPAKESANGKATAKPNGAGKKKRKRKQATGPVTYEMDVAAKLIETYGDDVRHVSDLGWFVYDRRWEFDASERSRELAKHIVHLLRGEAAALGDDELWRLAQKMGTPRGIGGMLDLARSDQKVRLAVKDLDSDPCLVNLANGTFDVRTGELRDHRRDDLITHLVPHDFDPDVTCQRWEQFLREITCEREELGCFLQRWIGYCLTGCVSEHALLLLLGTGCNGKSVLLEVLRYVFGSALAVTAPPGLLLQQKGDRHPTELARLRGRRLVIANEVPNGALFNEERVKSLTGGDGISARGMRQDFFDFVPTHKLMIAANEAPRVRDTSAGFWRRMRLIPFDANFEGREDRGLTQTLRGEAAGILAWALRGAVEWYREGLGAPVVVKEATDAYKKAEDKIGPFLTAHILFEPDAVTPKRDIKTALEDYLDGERPPSAKRLAAAIRAAAERCCALVSETTTVLDAKKARAWKGVRLVL